MASRKYLDKSILVIDDFMQHLHFMKKTLESIGFRDINLVQRARAAVLACKENNYDIILCDYNMGDGKNGQQILEEIKFCHYIKPSCVFILITAETSREVVLGAIECEPDGYIVKPFNELVLRRKIDRSLEQQECLKVINNAIDVKNYQEAIELCGTVARETPRYQSWCLKTKANLHYKMGDFQAAKAVYKSAQRDRNLDWAQIGLGKSLCALGKTNKAIKVLEKVIAVNRSCVLAYDLLAQCYKEKGDPEKAQQKLKKAAKLSPFSVKRQKSLGDICIINSDYDAASSAYRNTTRCSRHSIFNSSEHYIKLARSLADGMAGDQSADDKNRSVEVHKIFDEIDDRFPDHGSLEAQTGMLKTRIFVSQKKPMDAMKSIKSVEKIIGDAGAAISLDIKVELARTYLALGDEEKMEKCLDELGKEAGVDLDNRLLIESIQGKSGFDKKQKQVNSLNEKGANLYEKKEYGKAIELFLDAVKITPKSIAVNLNLVQALLKNMEIENYNEEYIVICKNCLSNIDGMKEDNKNYTRFRSLKSSLKELRSNERSSAG